jgi:hypothetical protein
MSNKRGRPALETDNVELRQRRARDAERRRNFYTRHQADRAERAARAAAIQPTPAQLQQGEMIMDLAFNEWDAAQTLTALQLRVQDMTLAQDSVDARLQPDAIPIDEHEELYANHDMSPIRDQHQATPNPSVRHQSPPRPSSQSTDRRPDIAEIFRSSSGNNRVSRSESSHPRSSHSRSSQSNISQFFRSLPARNPFSSNAANHPVPSPPQPAPPIDDHLSDFQDESATSTTDHLPPDTADHREDRNHKDPSENDDAGNQTRGVETDITLKIEASAEQDPADVEGRTASSSISEHITSDGEEIDEDNEVSALDHTVQKLYEQFQRGHHGCSPEQHREELNQHINTVGNDHYGLNDIFNDPNFPSVLALPDLISVDRLTRQTAPTPAQWQAMFCGISPQPQTPPQRPMHVCLHAEETQAIETDVAFDIDSFLGFFRSLAAARQGIEYQPAPIMRQNITTDVHLQTLVYDQPDAPEQVPRSSLAMLKDVPHFLLGRVVGATNITVHILFSHLPVAQEKFVSLTKEQISRWVNEIFNPAVYRACRAHYTSHLPASFRHALANSKAHQVEGRQIETASYQAQQSISYVLQPIYLEQIWADILNTVNHTPGLQHFREPQLFFSAKGTKLLFKSNPLRPTLFETMENFQSYFERVIDMDLIFRDRFYVDLGKEICPYLGLVPSQEYVLEDQAEVYLWKRCCLEHYIHNIYDGNPPAKGGQGQRYYDQNMLYAASSLTSITPKQSKLRQGGIVYSQFYSTVKEISDASKCLPFDNDGLEELALDPQIRRGARDLARGRRRDIKIIERAYCASKQRARDALNNSRRKSFAIREEHRITWTLYQALLARIRLENPEDWDIVMTECPSYAWAINTDVYLNFLWRSADKFATGFEIVRAHCYKELVIWEQTKMMAMFLRCLRFVFGGHQLQRESALWWSRRELPTRIWYGLGFCNTMPRYQYCWLEPRLDWNQLTFREEITERVLFGNDMLRGQYLRRGGQVRDFFGATRQLELALMWIDRHHQNRPIRDRLVSWIVHICLHQFRVDILSNVKSELSPDYREEALRDTQPFSFEYLEQIMTAGVYLMSGNRCDFKEVSDLVHFLFDFDDGRIRAHWEDRPFRKLYRRARNALDLRHGALELGATLSRRLWRNLVSYHWILPYPFSDGLMQTTKEGKRMWYSIQPKATASGPLNLLPLDEWEWARKSWQPDSPPAIPRYVSWSKEEWEGWIARHQTTVSER